MQIHKRSLVVVSAFALAFAAAIAVRRVGRAVGLRIATLWPAAPIDVWTRPRRIIPRRRPVFARPLDFRHWPRFWPRLGLRCRRIAERRPLCIDARAGIVWLPAPRAVVASTFARQIISRNVRAR